ncbi:MULTISPECIES: ribonuclease E/G [Roseobacteraceae]|jgi:Ribonuclease G/E|uniref:Ribonuclease n=1 Tax=Celeribacter baekdonensis B30 TaxID=1208323 RepID=K2IZ20_9RHOB|nr:MULTISPECIES: ribonuclease E/G [Roseobacteraceae]EKE67797.1 ribonuclease [Celeribacter baekdonensis B30]KAB6716097.1 ribonuclease G [Roseobacter sp. TSBP12]|tara:strand:+ start:18995 stop:20035 length:1041 start_codon:yes stop_codon:yes gene_type:complete
MIGSVIALGEINGQKAAAWIVDGRLEDLIVDAGEDAPPAPGAIFRAKGGRSLKGMGGALLDLPNGEQAYLRGNKGLKPGAPMLVQVSHIAEPGKAVPVLTRLLFKSKYAIITPEAPGLNISRQISDDEALIRLHELASEGMDGADETLGLILRSACEGATDEAVADDIAAMRTLAEAVLADLPGTPELLVDGPDAWEVAWRDWPEVDVFDDSEQAFDNHGVHELIDAALDPRVPLKSGASAYIEPTRALVAIDVNTGGDFSPAAGTKANIALARDLPRQLRLRGLAGQITIDLAPMPKKDRLPFEQALKAAFKSDGNDTVLAGWTPLGHFEIQKKRTRVPLTQALS